MIRLYHNFLQLHLIFFYHNNILLFLNMFLHLLQRYLIFHKLKLPHQNALMMYSIFLLILIILFLEDYPYLHSFLINYMLYLIILKLYLIYFVLDKFHILEKDLGKYLDNIVNKLLYIIKLYYTVFSDKNLQIYLYMKKGQLHHGLILE